MVWMLHSDSRKCEKCPWLTGLLKTLVIGCLVFTTYLLFRLEREQHQAVQAASRRHVTTRDRPGYIEVQMTRPGYVRGARQWDGGDYEEESETREDVNPDEQDEDMFTTDKPLAVWGEWSRWSRCSTHKFCQEGSQHRKRKCISVEGSDHCTGVWMESRDCPAGSCNFNYNRTPLLADESPAAETSFIGQECNATTKYYGRGKFADQIPQDVFVLFPGARKMMTSGFFALQEIPKVLTREDPITKVCFEPFGKWSLAAVRRTFKLNRHTKASLKNMRSNNLVGLAIGLKPDGSLYGVLVATGTPGAMYSAVYYRRWRGRSFHEDYLTF